MEFSAIERREIIHKTVLEVEDQEGALGVAHTIPIPIRGEAYRIDTLIKFPQVGRALLWWWGAGLACRP